MSVPKLSFAKLLCDSGVNGSILFGYFMILPIGGFNEGSLF